MTKFILSSQSHPRRHCPVVVSCPKPAGDAFAVVGPTGEKTPAQFIDDATLVFIVDELPPHAELAYEVVPVDAAAEGVKIHVKAQGDFDVTVDGRLFTTLHTGSQWVRPFLFPVIGPYGSGLTRAWPVIPDVPGETRDHVHQKSFWTGWGDVNGSDGWCEEAGKYASVLVREAAILENGPVRARIQLRCDWISEKGVKLMEETRLYTFYALPAAARPVDVECTFTATEGAVRFGDTKEGGICSIRVATSMDASGNGTIRNSYGAIGEEENWGKRAQWCDYYGPVPGGTAGICIMDNPANLRYPTYWHVRNYGLMTANPFGLSYFTDGAIKDGSHVLEAAQSLTFRYRVLFHAGCTCGAQVAEKYHDYINPPKAKLAD